jgi:hypothetical protein
MERKESKPIGAVMMSVVLLLLPMLYVLSIGPAVWLLDRGAISKKLLYTAYAPVDWLVHQNETFGDAMEWYCGLWAEPPSEPVPAPLPTRGS